MAALLLSSCGTVIPPAATGAPARSTPAASAPATPPPAATPAIIAAPSTPVTVPTISATIESARLVGISGAFPVDQVLSRDHPRTAIALRAFRISCPSLLRREDESGLTAPSDWANACSAAASWPEANATEFFHRYFEAVQVGDGKAHATGYYEPEIAGCRTARPGCNVPLFRRPPDLIEADLGQFNPAFKGRKVRGKVDGQSFVPYEDRAAITAGALAGRTQELAYAVDPIELFFLEVQGSGRLRADDGSIIRVGYESQNGRDYTGIGRLMRQRGLIQAGSMQDIMAWLRANPEAGRAIMNENKSYVFFRELTGPGPLGALGLPVTPEASVATDPRFVPLGAPVILKLDRPETAGVWIAQDIGGAIKGTNRFDTFWGAGDQARSIAGGMSARGSAFVLLPIGTAARLASDNGRTTAQP
jgi:membrane-bound lytic murein transglycosylase A